MLGWCPVHTDRFTVLVSYHQLFTTSAVLRRDDAAIRPSGLLQAGRQATARRTGGVRRLSGRLKTVHKCVTAPRSLPRPPIAASGLNVTAVEKREAQLTLIIENNRE